MKTNWKNILLYIVKFIELLITGAAEPVAYENHYTDYRALFCQ